MDIPHLLMRTITTGLIAGDILHENQSTVVVSVEPIDGDPDNVMLTCKNAGVVSGFITKADEEHLILRTGTKDGYGQLVPALAPIVDELFRQGFRIFISRRDVRYREINTVQVCLDFEGSFAELGTWPMFSYKPMLCAPIKSVRAYGYVGTEPIEHGGTLVSLIAALKAACLSRTVFLKHYDVSVPNYGKKRLIPGGAYVDGFVEMHTDGPDTPIHL